MDIKNLGHKFLVAFDTIGITFVLAFGGSIVYSNIDSNIKTKMVDKDAFMKNRLGSPIIAKVKGKTIQVVIDENFSEQQKACIKEAVEDFDYKLTGLNYTVILDNSQQGDKCVYITPEAGTYNNILASTVYDSRNFYTSIIYPVNIKVNMKYFPEYINLTEVNEATHNELKSVIKHEMCHTLGLKDKYDEESKTTTIMYGAYDSGRVEDLTEKDLYTLNTVYKSKEAEVNVATQVKKPVLLTPKPLNIDNEEISM